MSHYLNKEMDVYCLIVNSTLLNKYKFVGKTGRKKQKKDHFTEKMHQGIKEREDVNTPYQEVWEE